MVSGAGSVAGLGRGIIQVLALPGTARARSVAPYAGQAFPATEPFAPPTKNAPHKRGVFPGAGSPHCDNRITFSAGSAAMAASENGSRFQCLPEYARIWSNACGEAWSVDSP